MVGMWSQVYLLNGVINEEYAVKLVELLADEFQSIIGKHFAHVTELSQSPDACYVLQSGPGRTCESHVLLGAEDTATGSLGFPVYILGKEQGLFQMKLGALLTHQACRP